jgi:hypothetical protein
MNLASCLQGGSLELKAPKRQETDMKRYKLSFLLTLLVAGAMLMVGCSSTDETLTATSDVASDDYEAMDLDQEYGGLTFTDEEEAFGDDYFTLADAEDLDAVSEDPVQYDLDVLDYEAVVAAGDCDSTQHNKPVISVLRVLWGQLDGDIQDILEDFEPTDWSGMLSVDRGIVAVRRMVLFEKPGDKLIMPRLNRRTIQWRSHTGPHYDGLIFEIIEPPMLPVDQPAGETDDDEVVPEINMLHFTTPLFSLDVPVADLPGMDETYPVDETGNAVRFEGMLLGEGDICPQGFLTGIWKNEENKDGGIFKGRWMDTWGFLRGYVRGAYGLDEEGERVFYGKYIGRGGRIEGLLEGTWAPGEDDGRGEFNGNWIGKSGMINGVLGGRYVQAAERPGGFFSGRWATICAEDAVESIQR